MTRRTWGSSLPGFVRFWQPCGLFGVDGQISPVKQPARVCPAIELMKFDPDVNHPDVTSWPFLVSNRTCRAGDKKLPSAPQAPRLQSARCSECARTNSRVSAHSSTFTFRQHARESFRSKRAQTTTTTTFAHFIIYLLTSSSQLQRHRSPSSSTGLKN